MLYSIPVHIFLKYRKNLVVLRLHHSLLSPPPHDESLSNFFIFTTWAKGQSKLFPPSMWRGSKMEMDRRNEGRQGWGSIQPKVFLDSGAWVNWLAVVYWCMYVKCFSSTSNTLRSSWIKADLKWSIKKLVSESRGSSMLPCHGTESLLQIQKGH